MKFLVDAQLPKSLCLFLHSKGYDAIHTLDLPEGNATSDADINQLSIREE
jgi:predicted nuclease of predicted toxin-antitoxin system